MADKYTSRHTGQQIDDAVDRTGTLQTQLLGVQETVDTIDGRVDALESFRADQSQENSNLSGAIQGVQSSVVTVEGKVNQLANRLTDIAEDGLFYTDSAGNVALKYTPTSGFDVAKLSSHFKSLLPSGDIYSDVSTTTYNI